MGHTWPSVSTWGSPPSFQTVWLNQEYWYLWVIAGHQSAPGGLEWLPLGLKSILTRIDLRKMIVDPRSSFQTVWLNQEYAYLKNAQQVVECRLGVKGGLTDKLGYSWPSVSTWGSRMVAFRLEKHFDTHWPAEDDFIDPRSSFQTVRLNQECWYPKNGGVESIKSELLIQNLFRAFLANWIKLIRAANLPHVHSFFLGISDRAVSISPCVEDGNTDPQTPGMRIPNIFCKFPIVPLYLIFPFF